MKVLILVVLMLFGFNRSFAYSLHHGSYTVSSEGVDVLAGRVSLSPHRFNLSNERTPYSLTLHLYQDSVLDRLSETGSEERINGLNNDNALTTEILIRGSLPSLIRKSNGVEERQANLYLFAPKRHIDIQPKLKLYSSFSKRETIFLPLGLFLYFKKKF